MVRLEGMRAKGICGAVGIEDVSPLAIIPPLAWSRPYRRRRPLPWGGVFSVAAAVREQSRHSRFSGEGRGGEDDAQGTRQETEETDDVEQHTRSIDSADCSAIVSSSFQGLVHRAQIRVSKRIISSLVKRSSYYSADYKYVLNELKRLLPAGGRLEEEEEGGKAGRGSRGLPSEAPLPRGGGGLGAAAGAAAPGHAAAATAVAGKGGGGEERGGGGERQSGLGGGEGARVEAEGGQRGRRPSGRLGEGGGVGGRTGRDGTGIGPEGEGEMENRSGKAARVVHRADSGRRRPWCCDLGLNSVQYGGREGGGRSE